MKNMKPIKFNIILFLMRVTMYMCDIWIDIFIFYCFIIICDSKNRKYGKYEKELCNIIEK